MSVSAAARPATEVQSDFRIKPKTFDQSIWILQLVRDAIERSLAGERQREQLDCVSSTSKPMRES